MQRFFVEPHQIDRDKHEIRITGNDVNHIVNVLRMKKDEELLDQANKGKRISLCDRKHG